MTKLMRALLSQWFVFSVIGGEGGGNADPDPNDPDNVDNPDLETDPDDPDNAQDPDDPDAGDSRAQNIKALRQKAQRFEEQSRQDREARIAAEARAETLARSSQPAARTEPELPADADDNTRFVHEGNKQLRKMAEQVSAAQFESRDAADTARFYARSTKDADILKYEEAIEAEVAKLRGQGQFVPRAMIKTVLVGREVEAARMRKGNGARKPSAAEADATVRVNKARGEPARPRSDATGDRKRTSEAEARKERLRGKFI